MSSSLTSSFAYLNPLSRASDRSVFVFVQPITSLRLRHKTQIIVVDFEYASPNPAAFDIANHFHEWTADYHGPTPHVLNPSRYPTHAQRRTFLAAYLEHRATAVKPHARASVEEHAPVFSDLSPAVRERKLVALEKAVSAWSPASHAMWALWGLVQAREAVLENVAQPEFDYVGYARCRMAAFYRDLAVLDA